MQALWYTHQSASTGRHKHCGRCHQEARRRARISKTSVHSSRSARAPSACKRPRRQPMIESTRAACGTCATNRCEIRTDHGHAQQPGRDGHLAGCAARPRACGAGGGLVIPLFFVQSRKVWMRALIRGVNSYKRIATYIVLHLDGSWYIVIGIPTTVELLHGN